MKVLGMGLGAIVMLAVLWVVVTICGALGGWLMATLLDAIFTIDWAVAKTVGIVTGAVVANHSLAARRS